MEIRFILCLSLPTVQRSLMPSQWPTDPITRLVKPLLNCYVSIESSLVTRPGFRAALMLVSTEKVEEKRKKSHDDKSFIATSPPLRRRDETRRSIKRQFHVIWRVRAVFFLRAAAATDARTPCPRTNRCSIPGLLLRSPDQSLDNS